MNNDKMIIGGEISVVDFGMEGCLERLSGDHCHDRYEITYLLSASGRYIVEGDEHKVSNGSLLLISPMSYHRVEIDSADAEGITIHFEKNALTDNIASMLDGLCEGIDSHGRFYSAGSLSDELISIFDRFSVAAGLRDERMAYMQALLTEIIILLCVSEGQQMTVSDGDLGARVARYINANFKKNISLDKLARRFFVSKYYLCRAFKKHSGISVHAYINHKRIIFAKSLIESGMTASGAAEKVGYGDYSAFYRAYVKIVGKPPTL